ERLETLRSERLALRWPGAPGPGPALDLEHLALSLHCPAAPCLGASGRRFGLRRRLHRPRRDARSPPRYPGCSTGAGSGYPRGGRSL
ncbi:MAG: hypothetical protein AVDCRST_MAG01-01-3218, partial [uncultured Rubrobacteraceae bacterium]